MKTSDEKLEKLVKLYQLHSSEKELGNIEAATAAWAKLMELARRYNVELHQIVEGASNNDCDLRVIVEEENIFIRPCSQALGMWEIDFLNILAKFHFC